MIGMFVPPDRFKEGLMWFLMVVYTVIAILPQVLFQRPVVGSVNSWAWWPAACVSCVLLACAMTDYSERPLWLRGLWVITGIVSYFAVTWPANKFVIEHFMPIDSMPPFHARNQWAIARTVAGYPQIVFALRSTRWMVRSDRPVRVARP